MEHLCEAYPSESILFLKRAICTTVVTGLLLTMPIISCIYATWSSLNEYDINLRYWSLFRVFLFIIQIPLRYIVYQRLKKLESSDDDEEKALKLDGILLSKSWKYTQIGSAVVSFWVIITVITTLIFDESYHHKYSNSNHHSKSLQNDIGSFFCFEGYLLPCLLRLCRISFLIFFIHIIIIVKWLRNVMLIKMQSKLSSIYNDNIKLKEKCESCAICLDKYNESNKKYVHLNKCLHHFHKTCIDQWLKQKLLCPLCKLSYSPFSETYSKNNNNLRLNLNAINHDHNQIEIGNTSSNQLQNNDGMILRLRRYSSYYQALDVLLQSPSNNRCGTPNNSLFYFLPN